MFRQTKQTKKRYEAYEVEALSVTQQHACLNRLQARNNELRGSTRIPYSILFVMLLPTLASHLLLGPGKLLYSPLVESSADTLAEKDTKLFEAAIEELEFSRQEVLKVAEYYRSMAIDQTETNPFVQLIHTTTLLDKGLYNKNGFEDELPIIRDNLFNSFWNMARLLPTRKFQQYGEKTLLAKGNVNKVVKTTVSPQAQVLLEGSLSNIAKLLQESYTESNYRLSTLKNSRTETIETYKKLANRAAFVSANSKVTLCIIPLAILMRLLLDFGINRYYKKDFQNKKHSPDELKNQITKLKKHNAELEKQFRDYMYFMISLMMVALSTAIYNLTKNNEKYPALYIFILSTCASLLSDAIKFCKATYNKSQFEDNMQQINNSLNDAVICTGSKWQSFKGNSLTTSFLSFEPKKEMDHLPISKVVKSIMKKHGISGIICKDKSLTIIPVLLNKKTAAEINQEVDKILIQLRKDASENTKFYMPSDSDDDEDNEKKVSEKVKPPTGKQKEKPVGRKHRGKFFGHKPKDTPTCSSKVEQKPVAPNETKTNSNNLYTYAVNENAQGIGTITINPSLLDELFDEPKRILINLCVAGNIIRGESKGMNGLIRLTDTPENKEKYGDYNLKLKNCVYGYRFFAVREPGPGENYYVTGYRLVHPEVEKASQITTVPRPQHTPALSQCR